MRALCVDDEYLLLRGLREAVAASPLITSVEAFDDCQDALDWARTHEFDVAFLDIRMPVMDGLELGRELRKLHPKVPLFFCTGYKDYAVDAFDIHADGYLVKPVTAERVQQELEYLRSEDGPPPLLTVRCYGGFEVYDAQGQPLRFRRTRARELLALLVHRGGMGITAKKVCALMFEDDGEMDQKNMNYFFKLYYDLVRVLQETGAGEVLQKNYNNYCVDMSRIRVDETGKGTLPYLEEYDWAEEI